ncbi:MAG: DUF2087 domain-containing protein [Defluviitaleaceae bacterium]|nr:DUF2087 domain-containing protein [Defluviitaleaceae bacterium]
MDSSLFWNASTEDLKRGFTLDGLNGVYTCLICGEAFEDGIIYPMNDTLYDAGKAVEAHMKSQHPPIFEHFLNMGRVYTGLSAGQEELSRLFYAGYSDKEIVAITGANSASTIRNQRFAIREKYKQAKVLVALVELLEEKMAKKASATEKLVDFHPTATSIDERFAITQAEKDEVLARYFGPDGKLLIKSFPAKEKKKIIIMQKLVDNFRPGRHYTEKDVNEILKQFYDDFVSVRRCLIQYGFLDRIGDGTDYWVKV